ncbi:MAG: hypothetical protein WA322_03320 [Pseudolabrys sp.]
MVSPLRERIILVRGRGVELRIGDHFEKVTMKKITRPKPACGSKTGVRTGNVVTGLNLL